MMCRVMHDIVSTTQLISPIYCYQKHLTLAWFCSFKVKFSDSILIDSVVLSLLFIFMEQKHTHPERF